MKKNVFRPASLDELEARVVLSTVAARVPAQMMTPRAWPGSVARLLSRPALNFETLRFEINWMRGMISHHGMAIQMASLALRNTSDPNVRSLAQGIVRAQTREIGQMQTWLRAGFGIRSVPPRMTPDDMRMLTELSSLRGTEFDQAFLGAMIEHHKMAIEEANQLLNRGFHWALKQLGRNIITTQTAEIGTMHSMLGHSGGGAMGGHGG